MKEESLQQFRLKAWSPHNVISKTGKSAIVV